ncbi:hypothetical protein G9F73_000185 [Clostridium estertheticum]|uniref:hypothetical protein n=1 Tax=Clostridium estertheticum TaxID=238834 RepID=UPI0013EE8B5A|nr:hypothetical protein [Clostridium estertheticum]MBZ9606262.1 hypothetical protein [Clostridium estertheticum]
MIYKVCTEFQLLLYHMRSLLIIPLVHKDKKYGLVIMLNHKRVAYNEIKRANDFSFVI